MGLVDILEKHTVSIFKSKDCSIMNKTKIVGNCFAQFHIKTVAQQQFCVTLCVTSYLRERHFSLNNSFRFYETNFMQLVSSMHDSHKEQSPSWETETCVSASCSGLLFLVYFSKWK
jgi:hypothetical protein